MIRLAAGAALAAGVALAAYRARALSLDGAIAAFVIGTIVVGAGGWNSAAVLLAFFVPSALLTAVGRERKRSLRGTQQPAPRNAWQVLANGGVAALCAIAALGTSTAFNAAFAGAFAAASADTWGTEIGTLARRRPVSILTFRPIEAGLSGGVSLLGTLATIAGALCVAIVASLLRVAPLWPVAVAGVAGALLDSVAGASLQARQWCPACSCECETPQHYCGTPTTMRRGVRWIQNDAVNLMATLCGAIVAAALVVR
ncbi:MAG TPA: DUF92 domain-containing protein [Candidatus Cybelea sp.]|nr:DUF92 domain-containing protein [Candidatus Cybelea sp.]